MEMRMLCARTSATRSWDVGSTISSSANMLAAAGDMRRFARQADDPETAAKIQRAAADLETKGLAKAGITNPMIGKLLDTFA